MAVGRGKTESPKVLKISTASAMELGIVSGRFYRGARNPCVNALLAYEEGCRANCAYCGLARNRPGAHADKSFIRVGWPALSVTELLERIRQREAILRRVCISMITHPHAVADTLKLAGTFTRSCSLPLSVLCAPSVLPEGYLQDLRDAGVDMLGVAVDAAAPELFDRFRGSGVRGPHRWDVYWRTVRRGVEVFGPGRVSVHLIVGLGETDLDLVRAFERVRRENACVHLFSFFAEQDSLLSGNAPPPWERYLRIQLARVLVEGGESRVEDFRFDEAGTILEFGVDPDRLRDTIESRVPFMTSGCPGRDGVVACNRPFGNCLPGERQWNYPYLPDDEETALIRRALDAYVMREKRIPLVEPSRHGRQGGMAAGWRNH